MRRILFAAIAAFSLAALLSSCGKDKPVPTNYLAKTYFDAWMKENYPDLVKVDPGIYVLEETPGTGAPISKYWEDPFLSIEYTMQTLDGEVLGSTDAGIAKRVGTYSPYAYYGSRVVVRGDGNMYSCFDIALEGMKVGGTKKFISPGWLNTYTRHSTEQEYIDNEEGDPMIVTLKVHDQFPNEVEWEVDSVARFAGLNWNKTPVDSLIYGLYFKQLVPPTKPDTTYENGNYVWVNYVGKYLNGQAFDTNIKDSAKFYGIYNKNASYEPMKISWSQDYKELSTYNAVVDDSGNNSENSKLVTGFSRIIFQMKEHEKAVGVFYSGLGYSYEGAGQIPAFSPLMFEVEFVDDPSKK